MRTAQAEDTAVPGGRPSKDKYKVTFESTSRYDKTAFPRVTGTLNILHF